MQKRMKENQEYTNGDYLGLVEAVSLFNCYTCLENCKLNRFIKMIFFCARPRNNKTISWHYDARVKKEENKEANCKNICKGDTCCLEVINSPLHR